jgi:hypothetical protein
MFETLDPDLRTSVIGFLSGLFGALVIFIKKLLDKIADRLFEPKDKVLEALNIGKLVKDSLESLRTEWGADRASIVQFHNGGYFSNGESMQKLTITHEEIGPGVYPLCNILKNVPLTSALWVADIINGKAIAKVEDIQDVISRTFLEEFGIKSIIGCPLKKNDKIVGMVMLHWVNTSNVFGDECSSKLSEQCKSIPTLLNKM